MPRQTGPTLKPKPGLKPYPFHDGGVKESTADQVIRLVVPNCPVVGESEIKQRDGSYKPNPDYTGEPNCQQAYKFNNQGKWDVEKCISLGHEPYYTKFRKPHVEEIVDEEGYVTDTKVRYTTEKRLNVHAFSTSMRQSSGKAVEMALARGAKHLEEFGYQSPCEFKNCPRPQRVQTRFGRYCSERHARLVAADRKRIALPVTTDPYDRERAAEEREELLENLNIWG